jgi:hypothetical protein
MIKANINNKNKSSVVRKTGRFIAVILLLFFMEITGLWADAQEPTKKEQEQCVTDIIGAIGKLENNRDPKCHATATRLENFMYGTKMTAEARFLKVKLQKQLLLQLWKNVSDAVNTGPKGKQTPLSDYFQAEMAKVLNYSREVNGDIVIKMADKDREPITLTKRDMDHYFSVAYALRVILALQQEAMFQSEINLVGLDQDSISSLKGFLDIFTLAVLQESDREARRLNVYEVTPEIFQQAWEQVLHSHSKQVSPAESFWASSSLQSPASMPTEAKFVTLRKSIEQKVNAYEAYNKISMQVFLRNLQVYFARHQWPSDPEMGKKFRDTFTEAMVDFAYEGWKYAENIAKSKKHRFIREEDVHEMWNSFVPFEVNEYEDVIFFPKLGRSGSLTIEAYDFDAFRDSGIHWRYLQFAMQDHLEDLSLEPDPFAAELLVEGIAQFGVLALRLAGIAAKEQGQKQLNVDNLIKALKEIQQRVDVHKKAPPLETPKEVLASSANVTRLAKGNTYFSDVTGESGIDFVHRSSDWLSRLLRSYIRKSPTVGTLNVPPAFGGSGAAAGDINNDGIMDVLLLSGSGNALYLGNGRGHFRDITDDAGIVFKRKDGNFPEPRQPIIADLDNDGWQDILITYANDNHKLYRNSGNGKFEDVSGTAGLGGENLVGGPAAVFDYNNDGLLDIYISYFGDYLHGNLPKLTRDNLNGLPNKLFKNTGGMRFEDVTEKAGVGNTGWGQALAHTDFDLDGRQDIIVGNDFGINVYYRNRGDGTFENAAPKLGTDKPSFTMNVGITDLNRDGFPDIYISNIVTMVKDEKYVLPAEDTAMKFDPAKMARMRVIEANDLFLSHSADGKLEKYMLSDAVGRGFSSTGWAWGANFFDFDNDGDDDLYCVNGMNEYSVYSDTPYYTKVFNEQRKITLPVYEKESNVFFVNEGGKLQNHSKESGTDLLGNSRSIVYLDFDNDGDLDIILNNYHGPAVVYRNNSQQLNNNRMMIKLTGDPGKKSNRDAIGARIIAYKNGQQLAWREIRGGDSYLSVSPKVQHMGLGKEKAVDITVIWPNGEKSQFQNVEANRRYMLKQSTGVIQTM